MGDRSGLTKLDRTNGYEGSNDYMRVKKSKLAQQNDEIRDALRHRNNTIRTDLFKGISINVNGRTQPTADELKRLILLNGGDYHPYYRYQTTKFMIATNLSIARMKQLRPDDRVVRPEWITESIQANCLLPYQDYQLFVEEPRGKTGSVQAIESSSALSAGQSTSSEQLMPVAVSYTTNYRKTRQKSDQKGETKSRDIREMFSKTVRSLETGGSQKKKDRLNDSQTSYCSADYCAIVDTKSSSPHFTHDDSSNSRDINSNLAKTTDGKTKSSSRSITMSDFVVNGSNRFPVPKVPEKKYLAKMCGLTDLDDIIGFLNERISCPEGITDEDIACFTKYFYDLMSERNYHNKFYEILDAFQQRVIQHGEHSWISLYNNLVKTLKNELHQNIEATQNLYQLITMVDGTLEDESSQDGVDNNVEPHLPPIN